MADDQLYQRANLFRGPSLELEVNKHGSVTLPSSARGVIINRDNCNKMRRDGVLIVTQEGDSYIYKVACAQAKNDNYGQKAAEMLQKPQDDAERRKFFREESTINEVRATKGGRIQVPEAYKQETAVRYTPNGDCFVLEKIVKTSE